MAEPPDLLTDLSKLLDFRGIPHQTIDAHELRIEHPEGGSMQVNVSVDGELHIAYRFNGRQRRREDIEMLAARVLGLFDRQTG